MLPLHYPNSRGGRLIVPPRSVLRRDGCHGLGEGFVLGVGLPTGLDLLKCSLCDLSADLRTLIIRRCAVLRVVRVIDLDLVDQDGFSSTINFILP